MCIKIEYIQIVPELVFCMCWYKYQYTCFPLGIYISLQKPTKFNSKILIFSCHIKITNCTLICTTTLWSSKNLCNLLLDPLVFSNSSTLAGLQLFFIISSHHVLDYFVLFPSFSLVFFFWWGRRRRRRRDVPH